MALPENFCFAPFHRLQIGNKSFGPCSYTASVWSNDTNQTIEQIWQSEHYNNFRKSFLRNEKNKTCKLCWKEEEAGQTSLRNRLSNFKNTAGLEAVHEKYISSKEYIKYPKIITLIPGNQCNLACVICSSHSSSKWNSEFKAIKNNTGNSEFDPAVENWNVTDEQYQDIVDNSDKIQRLELFGGEPFYNKKNKSHLIDKIIEKGTAKNIVLYFNTNCTVYDEEFLSHVSKHFKKIEIRASIDGTDKQFEYIRYGAEYKTVLENCIKFSKLPNSDFEIILTVSLWNFMYLDEYHAEFCDKYKFSVRWNLVANTDHLLLFQIPDEVKDKISLSERFKFVERSIKNTQADKNAWQRFVKFTNMLDKHRGNSVKVTFPKFYNLVKNHWFE